MKSLKSLLIETLVDSDTDIPSITADIKQEIKRRYDSGSSIEHMIEPIPNEELKNTILELILDDSIK